MPSPLTGSKVKSRVRVVATRADDVGWVRQLATPRAACDGEHVLRPRPTSTAPSARPGPGRGVGRSRDDGGFLEADDVLPFVPKLQKDRLGVFAVLRRRPQRRRPFIELHGDGR